MKKLLKVIEELDEELPNGLYYLCVEVYSDNSGFITTKEVGTGNIDISLYSFLNYRTLTSHDYKALKWAVREYISNYKAKNSG